VTEFSPARARRLRRGDLLPRLDRRAGAGTSAWARRAAEVETAGLAPTSGGDTPLWAEALGANVLDVEGNRYLDLTSGFGVAVVGHRHPAVVAAVKRQAGRLIHGLGDAQGHPLRIRLAEALARLAPVERPRVGFAISGADAVELAVKTALLATGRSHILAFRPSYHGLTLGALALSSRGHFRAGFKSARNSGVYPEQPSSYGLFLDKVNLYGGTMMKALPIGPEEVKALATEERAERWKHTKITCSFDQEPFVEYSEFLAKKVAKVFPELVSE